MKHIKSKMIFESGYSYEHLPTIEDIKDICLELSDIGFTIKYEVFDNFISLYIFKGEYQGEWYRFNYSIVKEYNDRIREYLGDLYITNSFLINGIWYHKENKLYPDMDKGDKIISGVCIKFKRSLTPLSF